MTERSFPGPAEDRTVLSDIISPLILYKKRESPFELSLLYVKESVKDLEINLKGQVYLALVINGRVELGVERI